jgi:hypothetical protein
MKEIRFRTIGDHPTAGWNDILLLIFQRKYPMRKIVLAGVD